MIAMPMCTECIYGCGKWKDDGLCFSCRDQIWIPGMPHDCITDSDFYDYPF